MYRIVSNCGPLIVLPPYFVNQEVCSDMLKIYISSFKIAQFHQWDTEHAVLQCYLLFPMAFTQFYPEYEFKFK